VLEVLDPGLLTTVQDGGRRGWARYGIPPSGPMDTAAFAAANALMGNPPGTAGLEITLTGPVLRAWRDMLIAVCGAEFALQAGRLPVPTWHAVFVRAGYLIRFGERRRGARAYLAVSGGVATPPFLGSRATYLPGAFGGLAGRSLQRGDRIPLGPDPVRDIITRAGAAWPTHRRPAYAPNPRVRVVLGPQDAAFSPEAVNRFLTTPYEIASEADRMGIRLAGAEIEAATPGIVSDGLVTGSIQVPPDGQPIVMMVDHQTTGGYPKIATVIRADLPLLAQALPGAQVAFTAISLEEALSAAQTSL
jgi:biotin-dependent carboxylase-like uncharacterized protein